MYKKQTKMLQTRNDLITMQVCIHPDQAVERGKVGGRGFREFSRAFKILMSIFLVILVLCI